MRNLSSSTVKTILFIFFLLSTETRCSVRQSKLYEFERKLLHKTTSNRIAAAPAPSAAAIPSPPKSNGRVFYPIGYGADPTGAQDSTPAILEALNDAVKVRNGLDLLPGISDLGGVVIDFQGGDFRISGPITFPSGIANIVVQGGTLRASNKFPGNRHLIELCSPHSPNPSDTLSDTKDRNSDGMKYEDITFRDILFDSSIRGGGLLVVDSARIRVVDCFFLRFTTQGILVTRGHETFISNCFLGQHPTDGGDRAEKNYGGTGIDIASTDNAITDVVVFSAAIGIVLRGRANVVTGAHCYNKAADFGGVGISVRSAQNRIISPYMDFNGIVIEDPDQVHVSNGFFLGDGNIVLKSKQGRVSGLSIVGNMFSGTQNNEVPSVRLEGVFTSIDQVVIDQNVGSGTRLKSTVARLAVAGNGTKWEADFSGILLFPNKINHLEYSLYRRGGRLDVGFAAHAVTNVSNNVVVVESQKAVNAVVSVYVDQYNVVGEQNLYST